VGNNLSNTPFLHSDQQSRRRWGIICQEDSGTILLEFGNLCGVRPEKLLFVIYLSISEKGKHWGKFTLVKLYLICIK
jgi:hypothetical protein